jgi:hypothetical protein
VFNLLKRFFLVGIVFPFWSRPVGDLLIIGRGGEEKGPTPMAKNAADRTAPAQGKHWINRFDRQLSAVWV